MRKFKCPRCGHTEQAIADTVVHGCKLPHFKGERGVKRLFCDRKEVGVILELVA